MARALSHFNVKPTLSLSKPSHFRPPSSAYKLMKVTMVQTKSYWSSIEADIEAKLKKSIPIQQPVTVFEPMHHLVFAAPKTKVPALCVAACELVGGDQTQAMVAASALHLVHSAAHAHEHLPLTDRPNPNPKPTIDHAYGPNIELLTGDGIVPFGFELLARSVESGQNNSDKVLCVILEITRAIGSQGMIEGQYQELQGPQSDEKWIENVCKKKEGELHACGAACGAILGGGSEEEIERLRRFGLYVGIMEGMISRNGGNEKGLMEAVERMRVKAANELENFKGRNVEPISSLCNV